MKTDIEPITGKGQVPPVAHAGAPVRLRTVTFHPAKGGSSPELDIVGVSNHASHLVRSIARKPNAYATGTNQLSGISPSTEWSAAGPREKRVGLVHAVTNGVALSVYAASWYARRRGRHSAGAGLALAGVAVSSVGAYLGGHLVGARKVASHDPAYDGGPSA